MNRLIFIHSLVTVLTVSTTFSLSPECAAEETIPGRAPEDEAAVHFNQGVSLYRQQSYEAAAVEFARAYELRPSYKILFNIAQTEHMQDHFAAAFSSYTEYLGQGGEKISEERRRFVEGELDHLKFRIGYISVKGGAPGATLLVDGEEAGKLPLREPVVVDIGKREVEIFDGIDREFRRVYRVAAQQTVSLDFETTAAADQSAQKAPPPPSPDPVDTALPRPKMSGKKIAGAVLLGVGLAVGAGGAVTGGISLSKKQNIADNCATSPCGEAEWGEAFDTVRRLSISTDVLLGTAAASVTAGIILLVLDRKSEKKSNISAVFTPMQNGAFSGIQGRF